MKKFVIGDIHGGYKALLQCLERSGFNNDEDQLISLGDLTDGWPESFEVVEKMMTIKNLIHTYGNHDLWSHQWLKFGGTPKIWTSQGGQATIDSYTKKENWNKKITNNHIKFFNKSVDYHIDNNRAFVHGGFCKDVSMQAQFQNILIWDRTLIEAAYMSHRRKQQPKKPYGGFDEIFIGHTTTTRWGFYEPVKLCNVWCMDQGGGYEGKLSIMDIDTHEFWQSDKVEELYPGYHGRNK
jgi:serine/threonine protein phosphatase 1